MRFYSYIENTDISKDEIQVEADQNIEQLPIGATLRNYCYTALACTSKISFLHP
jgi:hypothetical protein